MMERLKEVGHRTKWNMDDDAIANVAAIAQGGSPCNLVTMAYYERLARHVREHDPTLLAAVTTVFEGFQRYRTPQQFAQAIQRVSFEQQPDAHMESVLEGDCAICLKSLRGAERVLRLCAESGDPAQCGHVFHAICVAHWELRLQPGASKRCPVCRAKLGPNYWSDVEHKVPRF